MRKELGALSNRAKRILEENGITIEKLQNLSDADLYRLKGCGRLTLKNIRAAIKRAK